MKWLIKLPALFTQFLLTSLLIWGLGGLIYYLLLSLPGTADRIAKGNGPEDVYRLLLPMLSALLEGLALTIAANLLAGRMRKATPARRYYLRMAGFALLFSFIVNNVIFAWVGALLRGRSLGQFRLDWLDLPFYPDTVLAGVLLLYLISRERKRTLIISEQEFQLLQLQQRQTRAELDALQARINPHFLYNALNSIASLVHEDPDGAERMVLLLARFFRYSTAGPSGPFDTVKQELGIVETYLEVEKVRFDERLRYRILLDDPAVEGMLIPRFLLQPLVENAIKHGISRNTGNGLIEVRIGPGTGGLHLVIHDSGPAFPADFAMGYGLKSIEEKLRLLYGNQATMEIHNGARKEVRIRLPLSRAESVAAKSPPVLSDAGVNEP